MDIMNMLKQFQNNPDDMMKQMGQNNPDFNNQMQQINQMIQQNGGNAKDVALNLMKQKGIDPSQFSNFF